MARSVDKYLGRTYDAANYNCAHLVAEAWKDETGIDIAHNMRGFLLAPADRYAKPSLCRRFAPVAAPVSPCIVLMQSPRKAPHVGIFLRGKVLHIKASGVEYQPLSIVTIGYQKVRFYTC